MMSPPRVRSRTTPVHEATPPKRTRDRRHVRCCRARARGAGRGDRPDRSWRSGARPVGARTDESCTRCRDGSDPVDGCVTPPPSSTTTTTSTTPPHHDDPAHDGRPAMTVAQGRGAGTDRRPSTRPHSRTAAGNRSTGDRVTDRHQHASGRTVRARDPDLHDSVARPPPRRCRCPRRRSPRRPRPSRRRRLRDLRPARSLRSTNPSHRLRRFPSRKWRCRSRRPPPKRRRSRPRRRRRPVEPTAPLPPINLTWTGAGVPRIEPTADARNGFAAARTDARG